MSNESGDSRRSSSTRPWNQIVGVPKQCWCGESMVVKLSKSEKNPNRRFFRCPSQSDNHDFKWVDDAMLEEIEAMNSKIVKLDEMVNEISKQIIEFEKVVKQMQKLEEMVMEKMETVMVESKTKLKTAMVVSIGGIVIIGFVIKLFV